MASNFGIPVTDQRHDQPAVGDAHEEPTEEQERRRHGWGVAALYLDQGVERSPQSHPKAPDCPVEVSNCMPATQQARSRTDQFYGSGRKPIRPDGGTPRVQSSDRPGHQNDTAEQWISVAGLPRTMPFLLLRVGGDEEDRDHHRHGAEQRQHCELPPLAQHQANNQDRDEGDNEQRRPHRRRVRHLPSERAGELV